MEKEYLVKILDIKEVTHDVKRFRFERPKGYLFAPGQATDVSIPGKLKFEKRPFTFTCLQDSPYLEFTIKGYPSHEPGITKRIHSLKVGDSIIIREVFGAIHYKGPGVFIAGGAGVTPFIAILRMLEKENKLKGHTLIFSNKTEEDIILKEEFDKMKKKGLNVIYTLTREEKTGYENRHIDEYFLKEYIKNFKQHFYICGPIRMVGELHHILSKLGAHSESIVIET